MVKSNFTLLVAVLALLSGCVTQSSSTPDYWDKEVERIKHLYQWNVKCEYDQFIDVTKCRASALGGDEHGDRWAVISDAEVFKLTTSVAWSSELPKNQRFLCINGQNYAGKDVSFRVDSGDVFIGSDRQCSIVPPSLYENMKKGKQLFVIYNDFPYPNQRTVVNLQGFEAAYQQLADKVNAQGGEAE